MVAPRVQRLFAIGRSYMTKNYDAIIIGTGQAGPFLAERLAEAGMKVASIERKLFGGTCINTGCTPTKAMVASAHAAHMVHRAADFGVVNNGAVSVDMKLVKARKDAISGESRTGLESWLRRYDELHRIPGPRPFRIVERGERRRGEADGGSDLHQRGRARGGYQMRGIEEIQYLNNSSIMDVDFLPRHLVIIGGGYIGLEFAQMYRRFGSEVTIIETGPFLARHEDEDVSTAIREILEHEGVHVRVNATCIGFSKRGEDILAQVECASGDPEVSGSHVLLAVGRRPNTDDLGLAEAGVAVDKRGYIVVDDQLRTSAPGIWALGDCNGKGDVVIIWYTAFLTILKSSPGIFLDNDPRKVSDRITAYALFIDPPLGRAGLTEGEVRKSGRRALIGRRQMTEALAGAG